MSRERRRRRFAVDCDNGTYTATAGTVAEAVRLVKGRHPRAGRVLGVREAPPAPRRPRTAQDGRSAPVGPSGSTVSRNAALRPF